MTEPEKKLERLEKHRDGEEKDRKSRKDNV